MNTQRRLGRYLASTPTTAQREKNWEAIRGRLPRSSRARGRIAFGVASAIAALAVIVTAASLWHLRSPAIEGAVLETRADEQETLTLADGSQVVVDGSTRVRLAGIAPRAVRLELERGALDLEVTHVDGRTFVIAVGPVEVRVVGTHLEVQTEGDDARALRVSVTRGRVEIARPGEPPRVVGAGETWSGPIVAPPRAIAAAPPSVADAGVTHALAAAPPAFRPSRAFRDFVGDQRYADAWSELGADGFARAVKSASAKDLFVVAQVARWSGHPHEAATAFESLAKRFPDDGRAGLAALELGRLRLNDLGDASAAVAAFDEAVRLAPNDAFREDASARRVEALEAAGEIASCAAARDEYLKAYPQGTHAMTVARRCPLPLP